MLVQIVRQPTVIGITKIGEIDPDEIWDVKWDTVTGGYNQRMGYYSIYGKIPYERAMELVDCSGTHKNVAYNGAKICIPESLNKEEKYREGYKSLLKRAGRKPTSIISLWRPKGWGPCTKKILQILEECEDHQITRKELLDLIWDENGEKGYRRCTINRAIKDLDGGRIITYFPTGKRYYNAQVLKLKPKNED